ncbi:Phosphatidylinositolglycan class N-domain-containing protein [Whalleya microplaca]|nr:Phosphatidylinositolglycan class N-domain-containing protein [Whalleya microplaca]
MAGASRFRFLALAMVFHLIYIYSIFDIYFVSPIVSGMQLFQVDRPNGAKAPADRLVLFVGDGLRADKAFQSFPEPYPKTDDDLTPRPLAPFLRSRVLEHGTFGVSHTRVPTESRPGHVALIAGLYEDVSAVATGWKLNPVNFDSVFNRSRHTWSWGSPDILPMFEHGATPGKIDAYCYDAEFEDFSQEALFLDLWVFDHVKELFAAAEKNKTLDDALRQDKLVFFLHLLGLDTTGHGYRPYSKEYLHNIQVVDEGVKEMTALIQKFYGDDRTAFVFTADHGMSDWGSHGDGHPDNTRTPLIAWGSGVAKPSVYPNTVAPGHDAYSSDWNLDHIKRHDVQQADVAALMAYLVGAEFPANSVGELPLSYLSADLKEKAKASLVNAQEILEMYRVKERSMEAKELRYRPYKPLRGESGLSPESRLSSIKELIDAGNLEEAIEESAALMKIGLEGMRYLQTYDWLFLRTLITIGYLGWMAYALTTVLDLHVLQGATQPSRTLGGIVVFSSILVILYASFIVSHSPPTYYAYAFFPVFFWEEVYARRDSLVKGRRALFGHIKTGPNVLSLVLNAITYVGIIESLALGYIHREILTVLFVIGAVYPLVMGISFLQEHAILSATWFVSCLLMSTFTLLPAMKVENITLIMLGGILMVAVGVFYLIFEDKLLADGSNTRKSKLRKDNRISRILIGVQTGLVLLAMLVTRSSALSLQAKLGLPRGNQLVGWLVLVVSLLMPSAHRLQPNNHYLHRLLVIFLTCAPSFVILTISYEGLFYFAFNLILVTWVRLEHQSYVFLQSAKAKRIPGEANGSATKATAGEAVVSKFRPLTLSDARVALFFFVLLQSAFFSTGNVASVSSFSLESVNRLWPIFDPLWQGALLILKLMIPFALISANLGILNRRIGVAPSALFMVAMALSDILTLYFFWVVKDEGSWLEIGSTISHFAIASLMCVFVAALEGVSSLFIAGVEVEVDGAYEHEQPERGKKTNGVTNGTTLETETQPADAGTESVDNTESRERDSTIPVVDDKQGADL